MFEWQINHLIDLDNCIKIMRMLPDNEPTYHVYGSFGDVYIQLSALKELLEDKKEIFNILIDEKYGILANQALGNKINKLYTNGNGVNNIFNKMGLVGKTGNLPIRLLPTLYPGSSELILSKRLTYADFLRGMVGSNHRGLFAKIEDINVLKKQAENIVINSGCVPGETILFSLDNNTHKEFNYEFWIRIMELVKKLGLKILLNDSGTHSSASANLLSNTNLPRIKVEPNMAVTIPSIAGGYIGGTNGFSTIQALFNDAVPGIHFLNSIESKDNDIVDKFGNIMNENILFHSETFSQEFRRHQVEVLVNKNTNYDVIDDVITEYVVLIKENL